MCEERQGLGEYFEVLVDCADPPGSRKVVLPQAEVGGRCWLLSRHITERIELVYR